MYLDTTCYLTPDIPIFYLITDMVLPELSFRSRFCLCFATGYERRLFDVRELL